MCGAGKLAKRLTHEPRLKTYVRSAHVTFELSSWNERSHRVDHHEIDGPASHQDLRDIEGLLPAVGLTDQ
jgi:hypothetical protein